MKRLLIVSIISLVLVPLISFHGNTQEIKPLPGKLLITVEPENETDVLIDGELVGRGGVVSQRLTPGEYEVMVINPRFEEIRQKVSVFESQITVVEVDLAKGQFKVKGKQDQPADFDTTGKISLRGIGGLKVGVSEGGGLATDLNNQEIMFQAGDGVLLGVAVRYGITSYLDVELGIGPTWSFQSYEDSAGQSDGLLINLTHEASFSAFPIVTTLIGKLQFEQFIPYAGLGVGFHLLNVLTQDTTFSAPGFIPLSIDTEFQYDTAFGLNALGGVEYYFYSLPYRTDLFSVFGELEFSSVGYRVIEARVSGLGAEETLSRDKIKDDFFFKNLLVSTLGFKVGVVYWFDPF